MARYSDFDDFDDRGPELYNPYGCLSIILSVVLIIILRVFLNKT